MKESSGVVELVQNVEWSQEIQKREDIPIEHQKYESALLTILRNDSWRKEDIFRIDQVLFSVIFCRFNF